MTVSLLGATEIRRLAAELDVTPTKKLGQNFVVDANTVRKIVQAADVQPGERVRSPSRSSRRGHPSRRSRSITGSPRACRRPPLTTAFPTEH
jgi:hypothetical protein